MVKGSGDTVHVSDLSNLTAQQYQQELASVINWEALTQNQVNITIDQMYYAAFLLNDILDVQANVDLAKGYQENIGYAVSRKQETFMTSKVGSLTTHDVGTLPVDLTATDYTTAWQKLAETGLLEQSPDAGDEFSLFLSPAAYASALNLDVFINRQYNPEGDAIRRAHIGDIFGMPVFLSNLLTSVSSGHDNVMMHKGCFAFIEQQPIKVVSDYIIENFSDGVAGYAIYGGAELVYPGEAEANVSAVDNRGVRMRGP